MEDVKPIIIPTRFKGKISHEMSFPIGAEKVSKALLDAPQFSDIILHFKTPQQRQIYLRSYACIGITRSSRRAEMAEKFLDSNGIPLFNEYELEIYPVPRIYRHRIQEHIIDHALPAVNEWLHHRARFRQPGEETLTFLFDEEKDDFTAKIDTHLQPQRT